MVTIAFVPGCSDDDDPTRPAMDMAKVRAAHLSPDAPAVDVWVDGTRVLMDVPFEAFSDYLDVPAGDRRIQVTPAGAETPVVIDASVTVSAGQAYTVAATGLLNSSDLTPIVLVDEPTSGSDPWVRFAHTSPDAPAVDIVVSGGPTLFDGVAFRQAAGYNPVGAGTYDLEVRLDDGGALALSIPNVTLDPNTSYTAFAVGLAGDGSLKAILVKDTASE
jgi:hypothetical protein